MKSRKLNDAFSYVADEYLDLVESQKKRIRPFRVISGVVAACLCLVLFVPFATMAAEWLGIKDLLLPKTTITYPKQGTESTEIIMIEEEVDMIGLSGYVDSPQMQALNEWQSFLNSYDTDGTVIAEVGNSIPDFGEQYFLYNVYSEEMRDKLDEIVNKYQLRLHTTLNVVNQEELAYRVGGVFMPGQTGWAYIYEDGTFQFDGEIELAGCGLTLFQFRRTVKGTFDEVVLNIGYALDYQEVAYTTAGGETVILSLGPDKALIYTDFDECFIAINVLAGREQGMTEQDLKTIVDTIDFSILKSVKVPDMRGDSLP